VNSANLTYSGPRGERIKAVSPWGAKQSNNHRMRACGCSDLSRQQSYLFSDLHLKITRLRRAGFGVKVASRAHSEELNGPESRIFDRSPCRSDGKRSILPRRSGIIFKPVTCTRPH
jgi:hypothetical protein